MNDSVIVILEKFSGVRVKDLVFITFRGQEIPLKIILYNATFDILLNGIPLTSNGKKNCLELNIDLEEKNANLVWLGVAETACPLGAAQPGNSLLDLTEAIAQVLRLEKITLTDASTVMCDKSQEEINLRILKIFQTGKSWYEGKGYVPEKEAEASKYRSQVEKFVSYKISEVQKELAAINPLDIVNIVEEVSNWKDSKERTKILMYCKKFFSKRVLFDYEVSLFKLKNQSELFSDFMSWLYGENCEKYTVIYRLIFPDYIQKTYYKKPKSAKKLSINEDFPSHPELTKKIKL